MTTSRDRRVALLFGLLLTAGCSVGLERGAQELDSVEAAFRTVVNELGLRERLELRADPRPLLRDTAPEPDLASLVFHSDSATVAMRAECWPRPGPNAEWRVVETRMLLHLES